jgi:hypothetical protein
MSHKVAARSALRNYKSLTVWGWAASFAIQLDQLSAARKELNGGQFEELNGGQFEELNGGQFEELNGGQFEELNGGQFDIWGQEN